MKKISLVLALVLLFGCLAFAEETVNTSKDFFASANADENAKKDIQDRATVKIEQYQKILHGAALDHVEINVNYGTMASGDFIALVYMNYDQMAGPSSDVTTILTVSATIASAVRSSCPEVVEATVLWELPAYNSQAKVPFTLDDVGVHFGEAMLPKVLADAFGF